MPKYLMYLFQYILFVVIFLNADIKASAYYAVFIKLFVNHFM